MMAASTQKMSACLLECVFVSGRTKLGFYVRPDLKAKATESASVRYTVYVLSAQMLCFVNASYGFRIQERSRP